MKENPKHKSPVHRLEIDLVLYSTRNSKVWVKIYQEQNITTFGPYIQKELKNSQSNQLDNDLDLWTINRFLHIPFISSAHLTYFMFLLDPQRNHWTVFLIMLNKTSSRLTEDLLIHWLIGFTAGQPLLGYFMSMYV